MCKAIAYILALMMSGMPAGSSDVTTPDLNTCPSVICEDNTCNGSSCEDNTCNGSSCEDNTCNGSSCEDNTCNGSNCEDNTCNSGNSNGSTCNSSNSNGSTCNSSNSNGSANNGSTCNNSNSNGNTNNGSNTEVNNDNSAISAEAKAVFDLVNSYRAEAGLSALTYDTDLQAAADIRAQEITKNFAHTRPDGSSWNTVSSKAKGENIAYGYSSASSVMTAWMNSSGHRANILGSSYKTIGIGCYSQGGTLYWVQLFGY